MVFKYVWLLGSGVLAYVIVSEYQLQPPIASAVFSCNSAMVEAADSALKQH